MPVARIEDVVSLAQAVGADVKAVTATANTASTNASTALTNANTAITTANAAANGTAHNFVTVYTTAKA